MSSQYPKKSTLWRGIILRAIVNATMTARSPHLASFLSWDGRNYVLNNGDGTYGAITYDNGTAVGVFFDVNSRFSPMRTGCEYNSACFFEGMSSRQRELAASETLQFNRQCYRGQWVSLVTAAFWDNEEYLTGAFCWNEVIDNGAHIVHVELMENVDDALEEWRDAYQMSDDQAAMVRSLFFRRIREIDTRIDLSEQEVGILKRLAEHSESIEESSRAFEAMGIQLPRSAR